MIKKALKALAVLLLVLSVAGGVYFFGPKKQKVVLYNFDLGSQADKTNWSCDTELGATLFPEPDYEDSNTTKIEGELHTGGSSIAIEIVGEELKFLTSTSVEVGILEPAPLAILKNDSKVIIAVDFEEPLVGSGLVDTFVLNKETGFAVWSKVNTSSFIPNLPNGQVYYLKCV